MTSGEKFDRELRVFNQNKQEWLQTHPGNFVVIAETTVAGFFPNYESAFSAGLTKFGSNSEFLVKQIWAEEPVYLVF